MPESLPEDCVERSFTEWRQRAIALINQEYEAAVRIANIPLERLNRGQPPGLSFHSRDEVLDKELGRATAITSFAVALGVITPQDALEITVSFYEQHPELRDSPETIEAYKERWRSEGLDVGDREPRDPRTDR